MTCVIAVTTYSCPPLIARATLASERNTNNLFLVRVSVFATPLQPRHRRNIGGTLKGSRPPNYYELVLYYACCPARRIRAHLSCGSTYPVSRHVRNLQEHRPCTVQPPLCGNCGRGGRGGRTATGTPISRQGDGNIGTQSNRPVDCRRFSSGLGISTGDSAPHST